MHTRFRLGLVLWATIALACVEVARTRTSFSPAPANDAPPVLVLEDSVRVTGQARDPQVIPGGSAWKLVGAVGAGDVYKRTDGLFTLVSRNTHEAYLVVAKNQVVGFYLPGEGAFAPAAEPVALPARSSEGP